MPTDDKTTWDWAVLRDEQVWKAHGQAVEDAGSFLPQSFDTRPRDIAEKLHSDYKTCEFIMYMFGIAPGLLHGILSDVYWRNLCKLIRGFQTLSQHQVPHDDVLEACVLLASWEQEFEEIYYQRCKDRLHFICPETFQKGPPICTAQWMIERTIGNLKREIRQTSNYLQNFAMEGLRHLGDGYALLRKCNKIPVLPSHGTMGVISQFLDSPVPIPKIFRWACLLLPNGQIARTQFKLVSHTMFSEVVFFTCFAVNDNNGGLRFVDVALVRSFSPPDPVILQTSHQTLPHCHTMDAVLVVQVHDIDDDEDNEDLVD
ncbi:hypothetical protein V8E55_006496 [Tylopilus felleus]